MTGMGIGWCKKAMKGTRGNVKLTIDIVEGQLLADLSAHVDDQLVRLKLQRLGDALLGTVHVQRQHPHRGRVSCP